MKKGIIILGGHVQALGMARIFGMLDIPVIIIDKTRKNLTRHSRYTTDFFCIQDEELLNFLLEDANTIKFLDWQIYPTNDFHVSLLSRNKTKLSQFYKIASDDWDIIETFYNKKKTYKYVSGIGIPVPVTRFPENESDIRSYDGAYPCIIKPAVMHTFYKKTKKKVLLCKDKAELLTYYRQVNQIIPSDEIMIQEIIPGDGRNQFSACYFSIKGEPVISLTACRMRQHPLDFGNATTYAETVYNNEILESGIKILKDSKYTGICEVEFKKDDRDNKYKFLEVNTRTWKWHVIGEISGSPFLSAYYNYLNDEITMPKNSFSIVSFRHGLTDTFVQIQMLLKGISLWKRNIKPQINAVRDLKDLKPWIYEKLYILDFIRTR